ncbi:MAG: hypothetical protein R6U36_02635 [Candidatus Fermentibacteraceae bacterium]
MDRRRWLLLAVVAAVCLPFLPNLLTSPGDPVGMVMPEPAVRGDSDAYQGVWHHWWMARSVSRGDDPRFCPLVYHPRGASLVYDSVGWVDCLLLAPVSMASPVLSYNVGLLLNSLLTLAGVSLLARRLGAGRGAALAAGLIAAWLPVRTAHLVQHYQVASVGWTALALAMAVRAARSRRLGPSVSGLLALFAALALLESPYHYLILLAGVALLPLLVGRSIGLRGLASAVAPAVAGGLLGLAFLLTGPGDPGSPSMPWREAIYWSAEPQAFLMPSPFGLAGRVLGMPAAAPWMPNPFEGVVTPGITVMAAALAGSAARRRWRLAAASGLLFLLALGPQLKVFGHLTPVPLPYRLAGMLPGLGGARAASRFALLGGMLLAVAAGRTIMSLRGWKRTGLAVVVALELLPPGLPAVDGGYPGEYGELEGVGPVLELPVTAQARRYLYLQTVDGNPRYVTFLARPPAWAEGYVRRLDSLARAAGSPEELAESAGAGAVVEGHWLVEEAAEDSVSVSLPGGGP